MDRSDVCCGFGGVFTVKHENIAVGMAQDKIAEAEKVEAEYIISTDLSCLVHMDGYIKKQNKNIKALHLIDALAQGWE